MKMPFQIQARVQELRRETVEIVATRSAKHSSGQEKVKREQRIKRLSEIRNELLSLVAKGGAIGALTQEPQRE